MSDDSDGYEREAERSYKRLVEADKMLADLLADRKEHPTWNLEPQIAAASAEHKEVFEVHKRKNALAQHYRDEKWAREQAQRSGEPERPPPPSPSPERTVSTAPMARPAPARISTTPASSDSGAVVPVVLMFVVVAAICAHQGGEPLTRGASTTRPKAVRRHPCPHAVPSHRLR